MSETALEQLKERLEKGEKVEAVVFGAWGWGSITRRGEGVALPAWAEAINQMRSGMIRMAAFRLGVNREGDTDARIYRVENYMRSNSHKYSQSKQRFPLYVYRKAAKMLKEAGL